LTVSADALRVAGVDLVNEYRRISPALWKNQKGAIMAGPTSSLTPEVGRIHYDDLSRTFRVCASFQLQTPLGNFPHKEFCVDAADLGDAIIGLLRLWGAAPGTGDDVVLLAPKGDAAAVAAYIAGEFTALNSAVPTFPAVPDNNSGPDDGVVVYVGTYGVTTP